MNYFRVKNWSEFQHYKDRNPPWIKLHRTLLNDYEFACLQDASKLHLMLIWLFASQSEGRVPDDPAFLKGKLGLSTAPNLKVLVDHGFLVVEQNASTVLASDASNLRLETETETEKITRARKTRLPDGWTPSEESVAWCRKTFALDSAGVEMYRSAFADICKAKGYEYVDFNAAFRNCVTKDWPELRTRGRLPTARRLALGT